MAPRLPPIPSHLANCFSSAYPLPKGEWKSKQVVEILAKLRTSELKKDRCGQELIAFYRQLADEMRAGK